MSWYCTGAWWHEWTNWSSGRDGNGTPFQSRRCLGCGKIQKRYI